MTEDEQTIDALRDRIGARVDTLIPPTGLYEAVRRRHRRQRTAAITGVVAAVVVGIAVPTGLARTAAAPAPVAGKPTATTSTAPPAPCVPDAGEKLPARVPAGRLPAQTGVRGSLAGDRALVDAAAVAGWQGLRASNTSFGRTEPLAVGSLRVVFVERAGAGTLALVTATDRTGRWQAAEWLAGQGRILVPTGGPAGVGSPADYDQKRGQLYWGDDPLFISAQQVCGLTYGVVLASPDATATITGVPHIGADARAVPGPTSPLPLTGGLAVVPAQQQKSKSTVTVSRAGTVLGTQTFNSLGSYASDAPAERPGPTAAQIAAAVRDSPRPVSAALLTNVAGIVGATVGDRTSDHVTGVQVIWAGPWTGGRPAVLFALQLPSGADYVTFGTAESGGGFGFDFSGLLPAGQLDRTVYTWRNNRTLTVIDPRAARAEADVPGAGTIPVPLTAGAGRATLSSSKVVVTEVRTYDSAGTELGRAVPGSVLLNLPGRG